MPPFIVMLGLAVKAPKFTSLLIRKNPLVIVVPPEYVFTPESVVLPAPD